MSETEPIVGESALNGMRPLDLEKRADKDLTPAEVVELRSWMAEQKLQKAVAVLEKAAKDIDAMGHRITVANGPSGPVLGVAVK